MQPKPCVTTPTVTTLTSKSVAEKKENVAYSAAQAALFTRKMRTRSIARIGLVAIMICTSVAMRKRPAMKRHVQVARSWCMVRKTCIAQATIAPTQTFLLVAQTKALVQLFHALMGGILSIMLQICFVQMSFAMQRTTHIVARRMEHVALTIVEVATSTSTELNTFLAKDTLAMMQIRTLAAHQWHCAKAIAVHTRSPIDTTPH
jgi:hypothetical protein